MSEPAEAKRKGPPKFQHFPINRAKVLKKAWIEKKKIKTKWKAQKLKEGLTHSSNLEPAHDEEQAENEANLTEAVIEDRTPDDPPRSKTSLHPSRARLHSSLESTKPTKKRKLSKEKEDSLLKPSTLSVRQLTREAYSRSALHTYKSHPLKRGNSGQERTRKDGQTGTGQPNMKLRMNAMLAKIKQDYA